MSNKVVQESNCAMQDRYFMAPGTLKGRLPVGFGTASKSHQRRLAVSVGFSGARLIGRVQRRSVDRSASSGARLIGRVQRRSVIDRVQRRPAGQQGQCRPAAARARTGAVDPRTTNSGS